jgi:uncharacterized protein (TIGR00299 family) protein
MKIAYYDCFSGISGDMNLGAMIDLGIDSKHITDSLGKLNLEGWRLEITRDQRHGITGTRVNVVTDEGAVNADHNNSSSHDSLSASIHKHHHPLRNLSDIEKIIEGSSLDRKIRDLAVKIFRHVAVAEAGVHNKPVNEIYFHEVGAVDSIIDIVGAAICFSSLGVEKIFVSEIELGGGMVSCEHGLLPVPAPATAGIITGFPVHVGGVDFEATTPTGAAIIAAIAEPLPDEMPFVIKRTGYGIGHRDNPSRPNILRVFLAETEPQNAAGHRALLIECNIDDMNPEISEYLSDKLFEAGADDVWFTPVVMKKGRPAFTLSIICEEGMRDAVSEVIFCESTTIGLRVTPFMKETLQREFEEVQTRFGKVMVKKSYYNNRLVSAKPEADRCAAIARETGVPMKHIIQEVTALVLGKNDDFRKA